MAGDVAARRDASWYDRPNVGRLKVIRVGARNGWSRCGRSVLDTTNRITLEEVPEPQRCRRSGCRERWSAEVTP